MEDRPYYLDVDGVEEPDGFRVRGGSLAGRPWVGIRFTCCDTYTRIYRNREGTAYRGCCPRCRREVSLRVGTGGTDARFFTAE